MAPWPPLGSAPGSEIFCGSKMNHASGQDYFSILNHYTLFTKTCR